MKKKVKIDFACAENWNEMSPVKNGKFCANCQKNIVDFTQQSKKQIVEHLLENKNVCGRIYQHQIETINHQSFNHQKNNYNNFAWSISLGAMLGLSSPIQAQINVQSNIEQADSHQNKVETANTLQNTIKGIITDVDFNTPLPDVVVSVENTSISTTSDIDGNYLISFPKNLDPNQQITFSADGFETQKTTLQALNDSPNIELALSEKPEIFVTTGVIVLEKELNFFQRMWLKTKNLFSK